jgi:hypothetical protein
LTNKIVQIVWKKGYLSINSFFLLSKFSELKTRSVKLGLPIYLVQWMIGWKIRIGKAKPQNTMKWRRVLFILFSLPRNGQNSFGVITNTHHLLPFCSTQVSPKEPRGGKKKKEKKKKRRGSIEFLFFFQFYITTTKVRLFCTPNQIMSPFFFFFFFF